MDVLLLGDDKLDLGVAVLVDVLLVQPAQGIYVLPMRLTTIT